MNFTQEHLAVLSAAVTEHAHAMDRVERVLQGATRQGVSRAQFERFRVNYLHRVRTTPLSVAAVVAEALRQVPPDMEVARRIAHEALFDELGPPQGKSHVELLTRCLDTLAVAKFNLPPLPLVKIADDHPLVVPAAPRFSKHQYRVFSSRSYPEMLGALYGREQAAKRMLEMIQRHLFEPLMPGLDIPQQRWVRTYFDVHLSEDTGVREQEHAKAALANLAPFLPDEHTGHAVCEGARQTLTLQAAFFDDLANAIAADA